MKVYSLIYFYELIFRPPELDQPRYRPTRDTTTREERIPNLRDSIQRNSSSSSSSDEDGSSFEDSFEQMMENWADDDPLVLDQTGKLLSSAIIPSLFLEIFLNIF